MKDRLSGFIARQEYRTYTRSEGERFSLRSHRVDIFVQCCQNSGAFDILRCKVAVGDVGVHGADTLDLVLVVEISSMRRKKHMVGDPDIIIKVGKGKCLLLAFTYT